MFRYGVKAVKIGVACAKLVNWAEDQWDDVQGLLPFLDGVLTRIA